ncbi:hypothetical protein AZF37_05060 [endosymbiont 'TC1' of Trimyema compressum]|uniref:ADP-ribosylglycohydrolase family protein n=1 Tax=endosymbiont 'TC1' of Trimyema compressum TaxID=243899 RepID=UPI0007F08265|nr:ADP-ribosylglycohydrolase family protein [endosymbiont 'TC1' of Trimyema compressum]AMP20628.1 hypothetical protein AZF37_05060 [endosymbiont 'TC1' of Trimyema compressum]
MININDRITGGFFRLSLGDSYGTLLDENKEWRDFNGSLSDDTYLSVAVTKGILDNPANPFEAIGKYFIEWLHDNPVGIGHITKLAFEGYELKNNWGYAVQYADDSVLALGVQGMAL